MLDRLPTRLAAPFRFRIDAEFRGPRRRKCTPPFKGSSTVWTVVNPCCRNCEAARPADESGDRLAAAFRQAETLLPALRREAPQLEARLASCFYWAALKQGRKTFPAINASSARPPTTRISFRLEALGNERAENLAEAHKYWQRVEKEIADDPKRWPSGLAMRVRLDMARMARNAAGIPDDKEAAKLPAFLRDHPDRPRPLNPSAEQCFRRALELAPDLLESHEGLIQWHRRAGRNAKAEQAARRLLERIPDHLPTLEVLADILLEKEAHIEALDLLNRPPRPIH